MKNLVTENRLKLEVTGKTKLELKFGKTTITGTFIFSPQLTYQVIICVDILISNKCIVNFSNN